MVLMCTDQCFSPKFYVSFTKDKTFINFHSLKEHLNFFGICPFKA